jgi:hypothetical protein
VSKRLGEAIIIKYFIKERDVRSVYTSIFFITTMTTAKQEKIMKGKYFLFYTVFSTVGS